MLPPYYFMDNMPYTNFHNLNMDWILHVVKTFENEYQGISDALDAAVDEIHTQEGISLAALNNAKNLILQAMNTEKTSALDAIDAASASGLQAIQDEEADAVSRITALIASLPENTADIVGKLLIIGGILQMNQSAVPTWVQGSYAGGTYDATGTTVICTQIMTGIGGLHVLAKNTNTNTQKFSTLRYFTGYADGVYTGEHAETINGQTVDYTFPNNAIAFSLELVKSNSGAISPTEANVSWNWSSLVDFIGYSNDRMYDLLAALKYNIMQPTGYTDNYYIAFSNGQKTYNGSYCYSDYIPVSPGKEYAYTGSLAHPNICFYDMQHTFISGTSETSFTTPANCYYLIISVTKADKTSHVIMPVSAVPTPQNTSYYIEMLKNRAVKTNAKTVLPANYSTELPDCDEAVDNSAYVIAYSQYTISGIPAHMPYNIYCEPGTLLTIAATDTSIAVYKLQFYITRTGIFARVYSGTQYGWGDWLTIQKPTLKVNAGSYLIRVSESGMPANIVLTQNIDLYQAYLDEKGSNYWTNYPGYVDQDRKYAGIYLHEHVNLNGSGHKLVFNPATIVNSLIQRDFSPVNLAGDNIVENLTIEIGNNKCRYAIHDDFVLTPEGVTIRNCVLRGTGHTDSLIGGGVKAYATHRVSGVVCLDNAGNYDITYHANSAGVQAASFLEITGCYCLKRIAVRKVGVNQVVTPCLVHDNKCAGVYLEEGSGGAEYNNMALYAWNNVTT